MRRVARRDQTAFDSLYNRYAGLVYAVALKALGSSSDAEEVVLDVFDQAWRTAERYDERRGRVDAWLLVMARSRSLDRLRQRQRGARVAQAAEEQAAMAPLAFAGPEEDVLVAERRKAVMAALGELPESQRLALELAYYKGLSQSEIAESTGEALGTVKTRMRLGMIKLRDALASWWSV